MTILKIAFTFWCVAMLMSIVLIFTGLFGLVPAEVVDVCATFAMCSLLIIIVVGILAMFIVPVYTIWR